MSLASAAILKTARARPHGSREAFVEDIADHGNRSLGAKAPFHLVHGDEPPEPADSSATQKFQ